MAKNETQLRTATSNREDGGARALPVEVKIVTLLNVALCAAAFAVACAWGCALPALGLALACAVSVATFAALREGGAA